MSKLYLNYIGGEWVAARSGRTFENINPADTGDVIGHLAASDESDTLAAIAAASDSFKTWRPGPVELSILWLPPQKTSKNTLPSITVLARRSSRAPAKMGSLLSGSPPGWCGRRGRHR